jgi:hypothetical protein
MAEVDPLILELRADVQGFRSELASAQTVADRRLGAIEKSGAKMSRNLSAGFNLAKASAIGFVASIGVDGVFRAVDAGLQYAASLGEVAQQLGVTTDALQEYRYAGSQAGLATEEVDMALSQLTRRIGEAASGTKAQAEAFEKLGVSVKDANGNIIDAGDAIPQIADALQKIESPAERAAILMDLFGRSGQKLEPLLSGGSKAVNELRDAANRLGIVLSSEQIQKADETADKLDAVKQVLQAKIAGVVADNAGSIVDLAKSLESLAGSAIKAGKDYSSFVDRIEKGLATIQRAGGIAQRNIGLATGNVSLIQNGQNVVNQADNRLAPFNSKKRGGYRANFAAQADPFEAFGAGLAPPVLAAAALGPNKNQAAALKGALNSGQQELLAIFTELSAVAADLIDTVEARVEAEKFQIEAEKLQSIARINADKELTKAQKAQAIQGIEALAAGKIELANAKIEAEASARSAEAARDAAELADIQARNAVAQLEDEYDLATSIAERARIAQQIVETETAAALAAIDAQLLQEDITEAKRAQLEAIRDGIVAEGEINKRRAAEGNRTASGQYLDDLGRLNAGDQVDQFGVDALKDLNRGLADAIVNGGNLGDVLEDTGKRFLAQLIELTFQLLVIKPLLESLGGGLGGGGGGSGGFLGQIGSIFGGLFGRASGGPVSAGRVYRVNEGVGKEFFRPNTGGDIIPLSKMRAAPAAQSQGGTSVVRLELSGDIDARIQQQSAAVAVEVVRAAEPSLTNKAVSETFRRGQRPSIGR